MKKYFAILVVCMLVVTGCSNNVVISNNIVGNGELVKISLDEENYTGVSVSHTYEVIIYSSDTYSCELEVDENIQEYIEVKKEGQNLVLGLKDNVNLSNITLKARIGMPELYSLKVAGSSSVIFKENLIEENLDLDISGSTDVKGAINSESLTLNQSGSSDLELEGKVDSIKIVVIGSATAKLEDLMAKNAEVEIGGSSSVLINVEDEIMGNASGSSELSYDSNVSNIKVDVSGSADLIQR